MKYLRKLDYHMVGQLAAPNVSTAVRIRSFVFFTSLMKILIGIWLLLPFNVFTSAEFYKSLAHYAPEGAWGLWLLILGITQMYGLFKVNIRIRVYTGYLSLLYFLFYTVLIFEYNGVSIGIPIYTAIAICELINCVVVRRPPPNDR